MTITVVIYRDAAWGQPFIHWLQDLRDGQAQSRIRARIERLGSGNFGDCKPVGGGVLELRVDYGPGYRVYLARRGATAVLLLCGGDKRKQDADIQRAARYLADYDRRFSHD